MRPANSQNEPSQRRQEPAHSKSRTLTSTALWLLAGIGATTGSVLVAVNEWLPPLPRAALAVVIAGIGVLTLMLASDGLGRLLAGRYDRWSELLYWLTSSLVALTIAIVAGAPLTLALRDRPGTLGVLLDFVADLIVGALAGALAMALVRIAAVVLPWLIRGIERVAHTELDAARWIPREASGSWAGQLGRGAAIGSAGLLLSAFATAIATTATTNVTAAADVPARVERSWLLTVALPLLAWLLGTAIAWLLLARLDATRGRRGLTAPHHRIRHGTHATAVGLCLLIVSGLFAATAIKHRTEARLWSGRYPVASLTVTAAQWNRSSAFLAQQFEPRFWLTGDERWTPTSVSAYRGGGEETRASDFCRTGGCYAIRRAGCDGDSPPPECVPSGDAKPALYYRYYDSSDPGRKPAASSGSWRLIQYWIFYNYDSLSAGAITQWHQADWEQVSVLVQREGSEVSPVEVAFSEHCYGARLPAERVRWSDATHPVVYVGKGSHANYPRPVSLPVRQLRCSLGITPRYFGAAGLFFAPAFDGTSLELPVDYLIGLRDRAQQRRQVALLPLLALGDRSVTSGVREPAAWGLDDNLSLLHLGHISTGAGPPAPPTQAPWRQPFNAMICSDRWLHTAARVRSETSWVCHGS